MLSHRVAGQDERMQPDSGRADPSPVLDQLSEAVIVVDAAGDIQLINRSALDLYGTVQTPGGLKAIADQLSAALGASHGRDSGSAPLARAFVGESSHDVRWRARRPDGDAILVVGSVRPVKLGRPGAAALIEFRDDSLRDAGERTLRSIICTLAEERDHHRQEAQTARSEAARAGAAKSDFLASMSHEIRTPLSSVIGYAELLAAAVGADAAALAYVERINDSGRALLTLVDDILNFSRLEANQLTLRAEAFGLQSLLSGVEAVIRPSLRGRALSLSVHNACDPGFRILADENRLRQVLLNLVGNAVKFTAQGRVDVRCASTGSASQPRLRFEVADTGIGISAEHQAMLFDRFFQVNDGREKAHGGSGLGLAICKQLVELMGGAIGVESEPGRGTTFWFELPLREAAPAQAAPEAPAQDDASSSRRVLVVDDIAANRTLATLLLQTGGHSVVAVSSGAEAIAAVQERVFDIVLMDVQMPEMDGLAATRRIRALAHPCAAVPIVALSANVLAGEVAAMIAAGMDGHVGKPFKGSDLLAAVRQKGSPSTAGGRAARRRPSASRERARAAGSG